MQNPETIKNIKSYLVIGFSIIISAAILGVAIYQSVLIRSAHSIHVIGSATKQYESDIIKWRLTIQRTVDMNNLKTGYELIQKDMRTVVDQLQSIGIQNKDITIKPIETKPKMEQVTQSERLNNMINPPILGMARKQVGYELRQTMFTTSKNISNLEKLALNPSLLFNKGILVESSELEYYVSNLPEIKRALVAAATKDSKKRAEEIAQNAGVTIGKLIVGRAGIFQITEPYSTEVSNYGIYDTSTKLKDITITVSNTFTIK